MTHTFLADGLEMNIPCLTETILLTQYLTMYDRHHTQAGKSHTVRGKKLSNTRSTHFALPSSYFPALGGTIKNMLGTRTILLCLKQKIFILTFCSLCVRQCIFLLDGLFFVNVYFSVLGEGQAAGTCACDNEPSGSIKCG